ncbi:primosomal protein N' [Candidatus Anaplasma sp. TIGMIC]|uniref:replication restart helicase PriA n=1 Tax=Candidatus Anaplasma sp. TIGMIC TaxID=3020713 RepID=UPI00232D9356|nr:primosomal protein N' [Candidatus Anaplasma sp. TIGMIC]MDB1135007.1 primosomal protein N' [Candidatus Anaplasma sp. TIGMIC]
MIAEVIVPVPLDKTFYYAIKDGMSLSAGDYVRVPFGGRVAVGLVVDIKATVECEVELKTVIDKLLFPAINPAAIKFIQWVSSYNIIPLGMVLKMVFGGMPKGKFLSFDGILDESSNVKSPVDDFETLPELSGEQSVACDKIVDKLSGFSVTVLDGKTGSGKTEVYCSAARKLLRESGDAQILVLLPEIVLATQLMKRLHGYFAEYNPVEWHSGLTVKKRRENWLSVVCGTTSIVVGARSALFLPFRNLKMIIVDEEHESSYKQDSGMSYNARDMSIVLAKQIDIPVVLCSATPALETMHNVWQRKYHHVVLQRRFGEAVMPEIIVADMRKDELKNAWLSSCLYEKISATLAKGNQVMLFLNRRGYARLVLCKKCGHKISCPNCCTWLAEHKILGAMLCHYCAYTCGVPRQCPSCQEHDTMSPYGVGIERIAEGIRELISEARPAVISSDISARDANRTIEHLLSGELNVIIGTQIIAKGHNFPKLTLVGVIDADLGMGNSDLRATEKTYQLLHQVSGRSGRYKERGQVVLQTYDPESTVIKSLLSDNREDFYNTELQSRRTTEMPPFMRLVSIIVSGKEELRVIEIANSIVSSMSGKVTVWGPAPAPISFVNNRHRYRILLKVANIVSVRNLLSECRDKYKQSRHVRVVIDVDPMSFI